MLIQDWPLGRIRPYPNNPRVLRNAAEKVAESIKAFGWRQPIVVDADGVIIVGHSRLEAAKLLRLKKAPVHVAKDLTPDQVRALRIADNKTGTFSGWDEGKLADELREILDAADGASFTGFSQSELDAIVMQASAEAAAITAPVVSQVQDEPERDDDEPDEPDRPPLGQFAKADDEQGGDPLVPFNVLMPMDARQVVYDAVAKAKQAHGLATTSEALLVIARAYVDA